MSVTNLTEALTWSGVGQIVAEIRRNHPNVRLDSIHPSGDGDEWEIDCHHLGRRGSFTLRCGDDWFAERKALKS